MNLWKLSWENMRHNEMQARVWGVQAQMRKLDFLFLSSSYKGRETNWYYKPHSTKSSRNSPHNVTSVSLTYINCFDLRSSCPSILNTTQKMTFSINDLFSKCDQIRRKLWILVTFTEEILTGNLHFFCAT